MSSHQFVFLGLQCDTVTWAVRIIHEQEDGIRKYVKALRGADTVKCITIAIFLCKAMAMRGAVLLARVSIR